MSFSRMKSLMKWMHRKDERSIKYVSCYLHRARPVGLNKMLSYKYLMFILAIYLHLKISLYVHLQLFISLIIIFFTEVAGKKLAALYVQHLDYVRSSEQKQRTSKSINLFRPWSWKWSCWWKTSPKAEYLCRSKSSLITYLPQNYLALETFPAVLLLDATTTIDIITKMLYINSLIISFLSS